MGNGNHCPSLISFIHLCNGFLITQFRAAKRQQYFLVSVRVQHQSLTTTFLLYAAESGWNDTALLWLFRRNLYEELKDKLVARVGCLINREVVTRTRDKPLPNLTHRTVPLSLVISGNSWEIDPVICYAVVFLSLLTRFALA